MHHHQVHNEKPVHQCIQHHNAIQGHVHSQLDILSNRVSDRERVRFKVCVGNHVTHRHKVINPYTHSESIDYQHDVSVWHGESHTQHVHVILRVTVHFAISIAEQLGSSGGDGW